MGSVKRAVRLSDIRPSGANPREDFGDIGALADAIRATGGEPVNPPVLVEDGNVFRIVDGERRWRALEEIYGKTEPDREVTALVYDSLDDANEVVAMLATDDKRQLTEVERARDVQQMLILGVDEERVCRASRATRGQVLAARMMAGRAPKGYQPTLDQMLAASELPDEDADAVMAAGDRWQAEAQSRRSRIEREEAEAELRSMAEGAGLELRDGRGPMDGLTYLGCFRPGEGDGLERLVGRGAECGVLSNGLCMCYGPEAVAEPEEAERERAKDEDAAACSAAERSMVAHLMAGGMSAELPAEIAEQARIERMEDAGWRANYALDDCEGAADWYRALPVGPAEAAHVLLAMAGTFRGGLLDWQGNLVEDKCRAYADAYDLMRLIGWEPDEGARAKRDEAQGALDEIA